MQPDYIYAESTVKPESIEILENTVYLRMNMAEQRRTDEKGGSITYWTYREAKLTPDEFNSYSSLIMSKNLSQLVIGQENEDSNLLIIMEAIADLYGILAIGM